MMKNIDKASNKHIQKLKKALVKHQKGIFALGHNDTQEFMKKQTMDFTLGIEIVKWTYWLAEYLVAPPQVFEWWSCQGWTAAVVSGSPSSRAAAASPALPGTPNRTHLSALQHALNGFPHVFSFSQLKGILVPLWNKGSIAEMSQKHWKVISQNT